MKKETEIREVRDSYTGLSEFEVSGFVNGHFFGILGFGRTLGEAEDISRKFNPRMSDARIMLDPHEHNPNGGRP